MVYKLRQFMLCVMYNFVFLFVCSLITAVSVTVVVHFALQGTTEKLQNVDHDSPRERIVVFAPAGLQVCVLLVVDHLVSGQIHQRIHADRRSQCPTQKTKCNSLQKRQDIKHIEPVHVYRAEH